MKTSKFLVIIVLFLVAGVISGTLSYNKQQEKERQLEQLISEQKAMLQQQDQLLKKQEVLETSVKDLEKKNTDLDSINNELMYQVSELKSKLTDQLQEMKRQKEEYENQLKEKDKQIEALKKTKLLTLEASAYIATCKGCSGFTALGLDIRNSTPKIIAVDPKVIPLRSKVEVFVNGESWGIYTAGDTGGAIKGYKCDILMSSYAKAVQFGRKNIKVRVL